MNLDKKGFAITGFLYSIFAIFLIIMSLTLISMTGSKLTLDKIKKDIKEELDEHDVESNLYEKLFSYTGSVQNFTAPYEGWYEVELWGAQGAESNSKGAYVSGKIHLTVNDVLYIYVGEGKHSTINSKAFNNGTSNADGYNGGGATDVRLLGGAWDDLSSLTSRIMVAAGSGAANDDALAGAGGTLFGNSSDTSGGTQLTFGSVKDASYLTSSFGIANGGCTGGSGYYPGGGASCNIGAGGGSSFISGYAGVNAITSVQSLAPTYNTIHYSGRYFINGKMQAGVNSDHGKAKITYLSKAKPRRVNTELNNVRYIRDCVAGNSVDGAGHWEEIQAIKNGKNIAFGKQIVSTTASSNSSYNLVVDGNIESVAYTSTTDGSRQCVTVDLAQNYDLDEVAVWHFMWDGRIYNNNVTSVSSDSFNWIDIISTNENEIANGKRISAYGD